MGNIETMYELRGLARAMISSEDTEFSAGAPFDAFADVIEGVIGKDSQDEALSVARALAQRYLESYSFIKDGSQKRVVYKSPAVISVIDAPKLGPLVAQLKKVNQEFFKISKKEAKTKLRGTTLKVAMEEPGLLDLGSYLIYLRTPSALATAKLLEVASSKNRRTNIRVRLSPPVENSNVVFGFNGWKLGFEQDSETLGKLSQNLTPVGFVAGENKTRWPFRQVVKRI